MTNKIFRTIGVFAATSVLLTPIAGIGKTVGVNSAVRNIVKVKATKGAKETQARVKQKVSLNNEIRTAKSSTLQVLLLDRSSLTVGPNARFTVDKFVFDPKRRASSVGASFAKGTFRFLSGKSTRRSPGKTSLRTPISSIGIRGTMVEGAVGADALAIMQQQTGFVAPFKMDPETASLIVLRGPGKGAQLGELPGVIDVTAGGKTVTVDEAGMAVFVPGPGAEPIGPFSLAQSAYKLFDAALRTTPTLRAASSGSKAEDKNTDVAKGNEGVLIGMLVGLAAIGGGVALASGSGSDSDTPASP